MYPFILVLVLLLAPWKPKYFQPVLHLEVVHHEYPSCDGSYQSGAWVGPDQIIHLCPTPEERWDWLVLHETQHIMASRYLPPQNWDKFGKVAMLTLRRGGYSKEQILLAKYFLTYGGHELHAELPWIAQGDIPPSLQHWYPWFNVEEEVWRRAGGYGTTSCLR